MQIMETDCETHLSTEQAGSQAPSRLPRTHGDQERAKSACIAPRQGPCPPVRLNDSVHSTLADGVVMKKLTASSDYQRLTKTGKRYFAPAFVMQVAANGDASLFRFGLTASRKVGNAVVRNRAKRRLREVVRMCAAEKEVAGLDVVLIAKTASATYDFLRLRDDFIKGLRKIAAGGGKSS